jgi:YidC/Oxa1 family membrane protein insertase
MSAIFDTFVYHPVYNVLIFLYNSIPGQDFGVAIILTTVMLKLALLPLSRQQIESQKNMQELQPKIKALQKKHRDDKEKQSRAMMELYKKSGVHPLAGCLPLIIQTTFLIAIYRVLINISQAGLRAQTEDLYAFVADPGQINHFFLNIVDLSQPSYFFAVLAAVAQYYQIKTMVDRQPAKKPQPDTEEPDFAQIMNRQMIVILPIVILIVGFTLQSGLSLYILASTFFMIAQQEYIFRHTASPSLAPIP